MDPRPHTRSSPPRQRHSPASIHATKIVNDVVASYKSTWTRLKAKEHAQVHLETNLPNSLTTGASLRCSAITTDSLEAHVLKNTFVEAQAACGSVFKSLIVDAVRLEIHQLTSLLGPILLACVTELSNFCMGLNQRHESLFPGRYIIDPDIRISASAEPLSPSELIYHTQQARMPKLVDTFLEDRADQRYMRDVQQRLREEKKAVSEAIRLDTSVPSKSGSWRINAFVPPSIRSPNGFSQRRKNLCLCE